MRHFDFKVILLQEENQSEFAEKDDTLVLFI